VSESQAAITEGAYWIEKYVGDLICISLQFVLHYYIRWRFEIIFWKKIGLNASSYLDF